LLVAACHQTATDKAGRFVVPLVAAGGDEDAVVATVDGRPIRASAVAQQALASSHDARHALNDLIDAEVLAGEAARRGIDRDHDAEEAAEAVAVRRLLQNDFEKEVTAAKIPDAVIHRVYEKNKPALVHDVMIDVWHILVPVDKLTADEKIQARAAAEDLSRRARAAKDVEAFKALAATVQAPRAAHYEHVITERDGWTVKEFSHPAFEFLKKPGDVSPVVETSYGFHVMYLVGYRPSINIGYAEAEPELRKNFFPEFQKPEFLHYCERLAGSHRVELHPEHLK
jgi:peptidyl-prolyl cis-trans isomerase C